MEEEQPGGSDLDYSYYVGLVRSRWMWIAATILICAGLGVAYQRRTQQLYRATASMVLQIEAPQVLGQEVNAAVGFGGNNSDADRWRFYHSQLTIMQSEAIARRSVHEAKLYEIPAIAGTGSQEQRIERAIQTLRGSISVTIGDSERVVLVHATHLDSEAARVMADAIVTGYQSFNLDSYRDGSAHATKWLRRELDEVSKKLAKHNQDIIDFKKTHGLLAVSLEDRRSLLANDIAHYSQAAAIAKTTRMQLEAENTKVKRAVAQGVIEAATILENSESNASSMLREKLITERMKLDAISSTFGVRHPERIEQQKRVEQAESTLKREIEVLVASAGNNLRKAQDVENKLRNQLAELKDEAMNLGPKELAYANMVRARDAIAKREEYLQNRVDENDMAGRLQASNVRPLDSAGVVPMRRHSSKHFAFMGAIAGLLLGIALVIGIDTLDSRVKQVGEIEELAGERFLGALPAMEDTSRGELCFQEAIRIARTNMLYLSADNPAQVVMVTSPQPQDGKSTTSYWMAASIAQTGKKVLLVDADMRSPSLHGMIGAPREEGLSELVFGHKNMEEALRQTDEPNLSLLPAGVAIRNPAECLASARFGKLMDSLRKEYDVIVIDTPPILPVTDASILAKLADVVLLVARCSGTERSALSVAMKQISRAEPKSLGVLANCAGAGIGYYYKGYSAQYYGEYGLASEGEDLAPAKGA